MTYLQHSYTISFNTLSPSRTIFKGETPASRLIEKPETSIHDLLSGLKKDLEGGIQKGVDYVGENITAAAKSVEQAIDRDRRKRKPSLDTIFNEEDIKNGVDGIRTFFADMSDDEVKGFVKTVAQLPPVERANYIAVTLGPNVTKFGMEYTTRFVQLFLGVDDDNLFFGKSTRALNKLATKNEKIIDEEKMRVDLMEIEKGISNLEEEIETLKERAGERGMGDKLKALLNRVMLLRLEARNSSLISDAWGTGMYNLNQQIEEIQEEFERIKQQILQKIKK